MKKVYFKDKQGRKIAGLLFEPKKSMGSVVICPGLAELKEELIEDGAWFAEEGFRTLVLDYIGMGESGKIEDFTLTNSTASLSAAIDFLKDKVFVFGESFGGRVALQAASKDSRIRALGLLSPLTYNEFEKAFEWDKIISKGSMKYDEVPRHIITAKFIKDLLKSDLEKEQKKIKCPVLITHGDIDKIVLVEGSKKLYASLNVEKSLHIFKGIGHNEEMTDESYDDALELILSWFKKHL